MKHTNKWHALLALIFLIGLPGATDGSPVVAVEGVIFTTPLPFSEAAAIGLDAYACLYPAGSKLGSEEFAIVFVFFSTQMQSETGFSDREMLDYARSTFLGLGLPAKENKKRIFAGREIKGAMDATAIPRPGLWESYLLSLADGRKLVLAFKAAATMDKAQAEKIIATAAQSFAEKK
jgi:hypothetical protein